MKIIVGLGNPGPRYQRTRHNLGFWVLEELSQRWQIPLSKHKFRAKYGEGTVAGQRVFLFKPQTFMNRSGETVGSLVNFYQIGLEELLIICDDLALAPGFIRIRGSGTAGGHKGLSNIISHLNTVQFPRLRVGIGQPPPEMDSADYVLQGIGEPELRILKDACAVGAEAVEVWLAQGLDEAMNRYNRKQNNEA